MSLDLDQKQRWLREFELNGFVVLRGIVPRTWVRNTYEQLMPVIREMIDSRVEDAEHPDRLSLDLDERPDLSEGPLGDDRYFRRCEVVEELVEQVFGGEYWRNVRSNLECVFDGSEWHTDQTLDETPDPNRQERTIRLTYNVPLVDFTWANGAMEILPGTHRLRRSFGSFDDLVNIYPHRLNLQRGDGVLRDGNCVHRATTNLTKRPRPMLDRTYVMARGQ
ncbi:hypothetical protein ABI59_03835 [Acidobacteria bacterium Mor1]|nr:hypothetical protein ABI59_03835 [Acidobacteria bacterium Mor1]